MKSSTSIRRGLAAACAALAAFAAGLAHATPEISLFFSPNGARVGDPVTLQLGLQATGGVNVGNGVVTLSYPGIVNSAVAFDGCTSTIDLATNPNGVTISGVNITAGFQCVIQLTVIPQAAGSFNVATPPGTFTATLPTTQSNTLTNTATLCVTAPLVVTNVNDSGTGSLRDAITQGNTACGPVDITFNIPGAGVKVIQPTTALPALTNGFGIKIDGYTQPGAAPNSIASTIYNLSYANNASILVELDGASCPGCAGITLSTFSAGVRGLAIHSFAEQVVVAGGGAVQGCYLGTDAGGFAVKPAGTAGVRIGASTFAQVGGPNPGDGNLIVGNGIGIAVDSGGSGSIEGNQVGGTAGGSPGLANGTGIFADAGSGVDVFRNVVQYNSGTGIAFVLPSSSIAYHNATYQNGGPGVDYGNDGPTPNDETLPYDTLDAVQNYPVVTAVYTFNGQTRVDGYLKTQPGVYSSFSPGEITLFDNGGVPSTTQGETPVHSFTMPVLDVDGFGTFSVTFPGTASAISAQLFADTCSDGCVVSSEYSPSVAAVPLSSTLTLAPASASFPPTQVGSSATPITLVLTNSSTAPLARPVDVTVSLAPGAPEFGLTTTCGVQLLPGTSCNIVITFTPSAVAFFSVPINIAVVDPVLGNYGVGASADGSGVPVPAPAVSLSPTAITFATQLVGATSAAVPVTLTNSGTAPLGIASVVASAGFVAANTCPATLAASASCVINVSFQPTAAGTITGTLTVTSNAAGSPHAVSLSGTAVAPTPVIGVLPTALTFAARTVNTASAAQTVTVTNSGTGVANLTSITVTGDFQIQSLCGATLAPAATCTIDVKFVPLVPGARTGQLTIVNNAAGSPHVVALSGTGVAASVGTLDAAPTSLDFGNVAPGSTSPVQLVAILNTGTAAVNFSVAVTGPGFALAATPSTVTPCAGVLNAGSACSVALTFQPTGQGLVTGALAISSDATNPNLSVGLVGTGFVPPVPRNLSVVDRLDFGSQPLGTPSADVALVLTNTGSTGLTISEAAVTGDFKLSDGCTTIPARQSCTLLVTFTPSARGARTGLVTLRVLGEAQPYLVTLSGDGGANSTPVLTVTPTRIGFGNSLVGPPTATKSIDLINTGEVPVVLGGYNVPGDFIVNNRCPGTLAVGTRCQMDVAFFPRVVGLRGGFLGVLSNAGNGPHRVELSGVGCGLPTIAGNRLPQLSCTP